MDLRHIASRMASSEADDELVPNPFPNSKVDYPVYHGCRAKGVGKLKRSDSGLWFAGMEGWVDDLYTGDGTGEVLTCWINVKNPYVPTEEEDDKYYGEILKIAEDGFFDRLEKEGYDAYFQRGESNSMALFKNAEVVNARTGKPL